MRSFLAPLTEPASGPHLLRIARTGSVIASRVIPALDSASRRTGLLKHDGLAAGEAMVIAPTNAIHTFFMRFSIDVLFADRAGRVVKICADVRPWRIRWAVGGHAVIEAAGGAFRDQLVPGDMVLLERLTVR